MSEQTKEPTIEEVEAALEECESLEKQAEQQAKEISSSLMDCALEFAVNQVLNSGNHSLFDPKYKTIRKHYLLEYIRRKRKEGA